MAYTARQLITRSWYLSGIVARGLQSVSGDQISDGLFLLNALLDWKSVDTALIPYYTYYEFDATTNQESYFIENLYDIELVTFNIGTVRYSMSESTRREYFGSARVDDISTLPFNWNFNRSVGGGTLSFYFKPAGDYRIKLMGKFGLTNVTLDTDMEAIYDRAYIEYLRFGLAEYMCSEYGILFNPKSEKILRKIEHQLLYVSPPDLSMNKGSMLAQGTVLNFGQINLGNGFRPT